MMLKKGKRASNLTGKKIKIQEDISLKDRSKGKQYSIEKSRGREVINRKKVLYDTTQILVMPCDWANQ